MLVNCCRVSISARGRRAIEGTNRVRNLRSTRRASYRNFLDVSDMFRRLPENDLPATRAATGMSSARLHSIKAPAGSGNSTSLSLSLTHNIHNTHNTHTHTHTHIYSLFLSFFLSQLGSFQFIFRDGRDPRESRITDRRRDGRTNGRTVGSEWFQTIGLRIWISFIYQSILDRDMPDVTGCAGAED